MRSCYLKKVVVDQKSVSRGGRVDSDCGDFALLELESQVAGRILVEGQSPLEGAAKSDVWLICKRNLEDSHWQETCLKDMYAYKSQGDEKGHSVSESSELEMLVKGGGRMTSKIGNFLRTKKGEGDGNLW